jgi:EAL and modified HD-GYP domain-containing signal transduction protein
MNFNEQIIGYEFCYRDTTGACSIDDARHATSSVLVNLLNHVGTASSFGDSLAFINTDGPLLLTDIIRTLPPKKFIFELSPTMRCTSQIYEAIRHYHSLGYRFALDNASFNAEYIEKFSKIFPYIEFAKFDVSQTDIEQLNYQPNPYGQMKLIAQRIEFQELLDAYKDLGFDYFQGFYFAKSHLISHPRIDPKNSDILALFSLLQSDASLENVYEAFKKQDALSLQLILFLMSAHPEHIYGATSMKEMLERLGKNTLSQWILLLIYSKTATKADEAPNPHTLFAQNRVDTMLWLLSLTSPHPSDELIESARLIALYSLLEKQINLPMSEIIRVLNPHETIEDAMLAHVGILGRVFTATLKMEANEILTASLLLKSYGVTLEQLEERTSQNG